MAQKKITDLQLRGSVSDDLNFPSDDSIQSYRVTALQILSYVLGTGNVGSTALAAASVTRSKLAVGASANLAVTSKTTTYTADPATDDVILCSASGGAFSVNLPAAASNSGKRFWIKKTDSTSNAVTLDGNASETIDGATTYAMIIQNECIQVVCDGSGWRII